MFPNLFTATQEYWRKLDALEASYQRGEISIEEVDAQVEKLMRELGDERRLAFQGIKYTFQRWLTTQKEIVVGLALLVVIAYSWLSVNSFS